MDQPNRRSRGVLAFGLCLCLLSLAACAGLSRHPAEAPRTAYVAESEGAIFARYAPVFVIQTHAHAYNRIGTPVASEDDQGREHVRVDPGHPTIYVQRKEFKTPRAAYTNLIYRVHFERVPCCDITMGPNVGVFAIVTIDNAGRPVLITTVHTCGCYKAFVPTSYLVREAWPQDWNPAVQDVYGEILPGLVQFPEVFDSDYRPVIVLRDEIHRVMDIRVENVNEATWRYDVIPTEIDGMEALQALPLDGETTSFFEQSGGRKGFVKESRKPFEKLFISWWALDPNVGCDKAYGDPDETGTIFYTSLKPWRRRASDMWDFAGFLDYWGWRL